MSAPPVNILFLFPDQWRFDWTSLNPELPIRTPSLEKLAQQGVRFTRALSPSPLCAPCRAILATGFDYPDCPIKSNQQDLPLDAVTFYQRLREAGYEVMGCGKFDLHKDTLDWGLDGKRDTQAWGFSRAIDNEGKFDGVRSSIDGPKGPYLHALQQAGLDQIHRDDFERRRQDHLDDSPTLLPENLYCDNWLTANGLRLLRETPVGKPWFLQVNFTGPHDPWDVTEAMKKLYPDIPFPPAVANTEWPADRVNGMRCNYAAMCENIDRLIGEFLAEVERRGELDRTLIVFSSDHGEMLGDHTRNGKAVPYQPSIGVPLIMAGPGIPVAETRTQPISILDLAGVFLESAGLPIDDRMSCRPLTQILADEPQIVLSQLADWICAWDGRYKLIHNYAGEDHLYDLEHDPGECTNLLSSIPESAEPALSRLRAAIAERQNLT